MSLTDTIDIDQCAFVAKGSLRDVYAHPTDAGVLVKVVRSDMVDAEGHQVHRGGKGRRPWGVYLAYRREIDEYLVAARRQIETPGLRLPFARPLGLVATTRGLGLLVERIAKDGQTVPTLAQLLAEGRLERRHVAALRGFFDYCAAHHIVLGDVHLGNLVEDPARPDRLICIDGFGEKTLIPVHRYSATLNRRKLARKLRTLEAHIRARAHDLLNAPAA